MEASSRPFNGLGVDWPKNLLLTTNTKNDATTVDIHRIGPAPKARISDLDNVEKHMILVLFVRFLYSQKEEMTGGGENVWPTICSLHVRLSFRIWLQHHDSIYATMSTQENPARRNATMDTRAQ